MKRRDVLQFAGAAVAGLAAPRLAFAQSYPARPVRLIVPFGAGGPTDVFARLVAQKLSDSLGKQFFVENISGASGNIGIGRGAKSAADGYTMLLVPTNFVVNPALFGTVPYDAVKDFDPVTLAVTSPMIISIHPSLPAQTIKDLIALIKANPGKHSYASGGTGSPGHLVGEQFRLQLGLDLVHVPFQSAGLAVGSAIGNHTPIVIVSPSPTVPQVQDGKLRALAVTRKFRSQALPSVPTMAECRLSGHQRRELVRLHRSCRNAERDHRAVASRDRQDRRAAGREATPRRHGLRIRRRFARRACRSDQGGTAEMGEGRSRGEHQGGVRSLGKTPCRPTLHSIAGADAGRLDDRAPFVDLGPQQGPERLGVEPSTTTPSGSNLALTAASDSAVTVAALILPMMSGGVLAGMNSAYHDDTSKPGTPDSAMVGSSGAVGNRCAVVTAEPAQLAGAHRLEQRAGGVEYGIDAAGDCVGHGAGRRAAIGHVRQLDAGHALEQFAGEVRRGADAGRGIGHLAGIGLGVVDELRGPTLPATTSAPPGCSGSDRATRPARDR